MMLPILAKAFQRSGSAVARQLPRRSRSHLLSRTYCERKSLVGFTCSSKPVALPISERANIVRFVSTTSSGSGVGADGAGDSEGVTIGIVRETYNKWERRAPLTPSHVKFLVNDETKDIGAGTNRGRVNVIVQPSSHRVFTDFDYQEAGATISDDLSRADVIMGVKQVDIGNLIPDKTYMFFAHVIKGQEENMPLLAAVLDRNIRLVDYECITAPNAVEDEEKAKGKRLVAFGRYAGIAGMIDVFQGLGQRLLACGYSTPFLRSRLTYMYRDLDEARDGIRRMGEEIGSVGLPNDLEPLVFAFTGRGNVTKGALEIFQRLPHEMITLDKARELKSHRGVSGGQKKVYGLMVKQEDMVARKDGDGASTPFDSAHYRSDPYEYKSTFHQHVAPYCNVIVNGIYWDERYPRVLTRAQVSDLYRAGNTSLLAVSDISCDVNGSIEFLERTTTIENPFFSYDPLTDQVSADITPSGIVVQGVDILPSELPRDSSQHFGDSLLPLLERTAANYADRTKEDSSDQKLPALPLELEQACIASGGRLSEPYMYIEALKERQLLMKSEDESSWPTILLSLEGHLFDSGLINKTLDILEEHDCDFQITDCRVGVKENNGKSSILIRVGAQDADLFKSISTKIETLADLLTAADATLRSYNGSVQELGVPGDRKATTTAGGTHVGESRATVTDGEERRVLVLGAGRVASSLSEYLGRSNRRTVVVVAGDDEAEVQDVARLAKHGRGVVLDIVDNRRGLSKLVADADAVVSLLPAPMHGLVAEECIAARKNLITASYVSDELRAMHRRCEDAGILILNEVGLDPGMDHMSALKIINEIKSRGGRISSFSSVCGGLPAPESANNPLKYKFSWSPMGVLSASTNSARYRKNNNVVHVDGEDLLASAKKFVDAWPDLSLECLANRDSLVYEDLYGIQTARTIFRGTLRYSGFSGIMNVLKNLGLFRDSPPLNNITWDLVLNDLCREKGYANVNECFIEVSGGTGGDAAAAAEFLDWLALTGETLGDPESISKSFCQVLEKKLKFEEHERDMVLMHHDIQAEFEDGSKETHFSSLQVFGEREMTAMCKTVGYTAAAAAHLVLSGDLSSKKGIVLPTTKDIYKPLLTALEEEGLKFDETLLFDAAQKERSFM